MALAVPGLVVALQILGPSGALAPAAAAQEEFPCDGVLADAARLVETLSRVPKYATTYVVVYADRLGEQIDSLEAPALREVRLGVYSGSPAQGIATGIAGDPAGDPEARGLVVLPYDDGDAGRIVDDILQDRLDAAVLWAPLAGLALLELDFNYELSVLTAGQPRSAPPALQSAGAGEEGSPCAEELAGLLEGYGVVPAEKLIPVDIRELLARRPPPRDLAVALGGTEAFAEHCARCHGPEAVAAPDELAPVDLLVSITRFSYPGFLYIVLNGRSENGMPGFRGSVEEERIEQIYQYVRERSHGRIGVLGASAAGEGESPES